MAMTGHCINGFRVNLPFMKLPEDDFSPVRPQTYMKLAKFNCTDPHWVCTMLEAMLPICRVGRGGKSL